MPSRFILFQKSHVFHECTWFSPIILHNSLNNGRFEIFIKLVKNEDYSPWILSPQKIIVLFFIGIELMKNLATQIGLLIRHHRIEKHITQEKLALLCDIDRSYLGRIERGEVNITVVKLYEISKFLDVKPQDLLPET